MATNNSTKTLSDPQPTCPTASFLLARADALDCEAERLYTRAAFQSHIGALVAGAVRDNCRAVELETAAECLRLQAARVADMTQDSKEMLAEGYSHEDVRIYLARAYGKAGAK